MHADFGLNENLLIIIDGIQFIQKTNFLVFFFILAVFLRIKLEFSSFILRIIHMYVYEHDDSPTITNKCSETVYQKLIPLLLLRVLY